MVSVLLRHGASASASNGQGLTPLHVAVMARHHLERPNALREYTAVCQVRSEGVYERGIDHRDLARRWGQEDDGHSQDADGWDDGHDDDGGDHARLTKRLV
jgi:hypothetical protein